VSEIKFVPAGEECMIDLFREKLGAIFDTRSSGRLLIYSVLVGIVAGLGAAVF
jgi:hypothetical protein